MEGPASRLGGTVLNVTVPGGSIPVEVLGSGPPLLLLHGWTLDRRVWLPQARVFAASHTVIAIDRRGFGQSSAPPDIAEEPDDLLALCEALSLPRLSIVGMSQGARVALAFAARHPARASAVVLQGAPLSGVPAPGGELPIQAMRALADEGRFAELRAFWRRHALMTVKGAEANTLVDSIVADYVARDLASDATLEVYEADVAHVLAPALVITGADEPAWRHEVAGILAAALGAERLNIASAGHLANLCRSDTYNREIIGFLRRAVQPHALPSDNKRAT